MKIENGNFDYAADESRSGVCPICGHVGLEYGGSETRDESIDTDWKCPACGSSGEEIDKTVFDGYIVQNVPDHTPKKRIYEDAERNLYFVRSGIGKTYKGFCRWKKPKNGQHRESGIRSLPYTEDRDLAQYQLDAYAV